MHDSARHRRPHVASRACAAAVVALLTALALAPAAAAGPSKQQRLKAVQPGGSLIVAYEKTTLLDLLPRPALPETLASPLEILDGPLNRIRVRFRFYRSLDALLDNQVSRQFTAPRSLSATAEGDYSSWRTFIVGPRTRVPRPLEIDTGGDSRAFGNPTATALTSPSGRPAVLVTVYVFAEGAAATEAGPLVYYVER